jgi:uncharacterized membrane protein YphA (DoxX/SURF4 family)
VSAQRSAPVRPARPDARVARARQSGGLAGTEKAGAGAARLASRPAGPDNFRTRASALAAGWAPTAARILLGLVLAWFGYHELVQPALWTGYVPLVQAQSALAIALVLAHGWLLLILAVALVAGIMPRVAAAAAAVLLLEVVISLTVTGGLSDLTLRDVGVLGLAIGLAGGGEQRLTLTS